LVRRGFFFKEILKALLYSAGAGYGHRPPNPNGASARALLEYYDQQQTFDLGLAGQV
jgi:hypothetical protein